MLETLASARGKMRRVVIYVCVQIYIFTIKSLEQNVKKLD